MYDTSNNILKLPIQLLHIYGLILLNHVSPFSLVISFFTIILLNSFSHHGLALECSVFFPHFSNQSTELQELLIFASSFFTFRIMQFYIKELDQTMANILQFYIAKLRWLHESIFNQNQIGFQIVIDSKSIPLSSEVFFLEFFRRDSIHTVCCRFWHNVIYYCLGIKYSANQWFSLQGTSYYALCGSPFLDRFSSISL